MLTASSRAATSLVSHAWLRMQRFQSSSALRGRLSKKCILFSYIIKVSTNWTPRGGLELLMKTTARVTRVLLLRISDAIGYAKFRSRSHAAVIRVYDDAGNVIETHEHAGEFKEW